VKGIKRKRKKEKEGERKQIGYCIKLLLIKDKTHALIKVQYVRFISNVIGLNLHMKSRAQKDIFL
jgi:hypothetical protein